MKYKLLFGIVMLILCCSFAFAQAEAPQEAGPEENAWEDLSEDEKFERDPQKAYEENPTAANFERAGVAKTFINFMILSLTDQGYYLIRNYRTDFAQEYVKYSEFDTADSQAIGSVFFSEQPQNVNNNKRSFEKYASSEGVHVEVGGDIKSYSIRGFLEGANQKINIIQFKEDYIFQVDADGNLLLKAKVDDDIEQILTSWRSFTGDIRQGDDGKIKLDKGSIDGCSVISGSGITLSRRGDLDGLAGEIAGVRFSQPVHFKLVREGFDYLDEDKFKSLDELYFDDARITSVSPDANVAINSKDYLLPVDGRPLHIQEGVIGIKNGRPFVHGFNPTVVDSFKIVGIGGSVDLYSDGFEHSLESKVYFSVDASKGRLAVGYASAPPEKKDSRGYSEHMILKPMPGNEIFDVEPKDTILFEVYPGSSLTADVLMPGVNPRVITRGARIKISQGYRDLVVGDSGLGLDSKIVDVTRMVAQAGSVPFSLECYDSEGKILLGTKYEPKKMIFNNRNEFGTADATSGDVEVTGGFSRMLVSERMYGSSFETDIVNNPLLEERNLKIIGGGDLKGKNLNEVLDPESRRQLLNLVRFVPAEVWKTREIVVYSDKYWYEGGNAKGGFAQIYKFHIPASGISGIRNDLFYHENVHNWHASSFLSLWEDEWTTVQQNYNADAGEKVVMWGLPSIPLASYTIGWEDGGIEPRYGFVEPYGSNNKMEDIATVPAFIINNPSDYARLIDPESAYYTNKIGKSFATGTMDKDMAKEWANTYMVKLHLCEQAGLITPKQVQEVIRKLPKERVAAVQKMREQTAMQIGSPQTQSKIGDIARSVFQGEKLK